MAHQDWFLVDSGHWMQSGNRHPGGRTSAGAPGPGQSGMAAISKPVALRHLGPWAAVFIAVISLCATRVTTGIARGGRGGNHPFHRGAPAKCAFDRADVCGSGVLYGNVSKVSEHLPTRDCA